MIINISYDSSVGSAPATFVTAINYVVNLFEATFSDAVTINIDVGWGEVGGQALSGALGASIRNVAPAFTYGQVRNALVQDATSSIDASAVGHLTTVDPTSGGNFDIGTADAKALGLIAPNGAGVDGWIGFTSNPGTFSFDPTNRAAPGLYDFIGVAIHEISEVMGRVAWLGNTVDYPHAYSTLDLFRYAASGVHQLNGSSSAYFSTDGGVTDLDNFNTNPNGDFGDWSSSAGTDAFLAFSSSGVANAFSATDIAVLDAIGWNTTAGSPSSTHIVSVTISGSGITNGTGDIGIGAHAVLTLKMSAQVIVAGGIPTLKLDDGGVATFTGGSGTTALTFSYVVSAGQNTSSLNVLSLNANGASILDASNNNVDLSGATNHPAGNLQIDTTPPIVTSVSTSGTAIVNGNGDLGAGKSVSLTLSFDETVNVGGGVPALALNDGGVATYTGGSGSAKLTFNYTVLAGQNTSDLQVVGLALSGATISDPAGNAANTSAAISNPAGILQIATHTPTVISISETPSTGSLSPGSMVSMALQFDEAVLVSGSPSLTLNDGGVASYQSGSGTSTLVFNYVADPHDSNSPELLIQTIDLTLGAIFDSAGNSASAVLSSIPQTGPQIHTVDPVVTQVLSSLPAGMIQPGDFEQITLKLNEAVTVSGSPTLILNDGGVATFDAQASTPTSMTFDYVVGSTDRTTNLAIAAVSENAATVKDAIGNDLSCSNAISGSGLGLGVGNIPSNAVTAVGNQTFFAVGTTLAFDGAGHDILALSGARSEYTITANPDSTITITDLTSNRDFTHVLTNIESLQFTDNAVYVEDTRACCDQSGLYPQWRT